MARYMPGLASFKPDTIKNCDQQSINGYELQLVRQRYQVPICCFLPRCSHVLSHHSPAGPRCWQWCHTKWDRHRRSSSADASFVAVLFLSEYDTHRHQFPEPCTKHGWHKCSD